MKLKTLAIAAIGLPLAGFLAIYGYAWIRTKAAVEDLTRLSAPFAQISHGSVGLGPTGTISVHDLSILAYQANETFVLERIDVHTPGVLFLVTSDPKAWSMRRLPGRIGISVEGLRLDTGGTLWSTLSPRGGSDNGRRANGLACDIRDFIRTSGPLDVLLPAPLVVDAEFLIEPGAGQGSTAIHMRFQQRGLMSLSNAGEILPPDRKAGVTMPVFLTPIRIQAALDKDYAKAAQALCAERSGLPAEQFLPTLLAQDDAAYSADLGMIPGPGIRKLLRGFLSGEPIEAQFQIPSGMEPASIQLYSAEEIPSLLDLRLTLNGSPIEDLSLRAAIPSHASSISDSTTPPAPIEVYPPTQTPPPSQPPQAPAQASARQTGPDSEILAFTDLARCLGCRVQVLLRDGRKREGIVDAATAGLARIKSRVGGGSLSFELSADDVAAIRILEFRR